MAKTIRANLLIFFLGLLASVLKIQTLAQPANDLCVNAETITPGVAVSGTTVGSTFDDTDAQVGFCGTSHTEPGVWYKIVGNDEVININTCTNTIFDTKITVFTGTCNALVCVDGDDDSCDTTSSEVEFDADQGVEYLILVHAGCVGDTGTFYLSGSSGTLAPTPAPNSASAANDLCDNAEAIDLNTVTSGSTALATLDNPPTECDESFQTGPGVWYQIVGTGEELIARTCTGTGNTNAFDTIISVFSGDCDDLQCESSDDDGCSEDTSLTRFNSEDGVTYFIQVHGNPTEFGNFEIEVIRASDVPIPINDLCQNPISIQTRSTYFGSTSGATLDGYDPCGGSVEASAPGVWYLIAGTGETLKASTCNPITDYDTQIAIYTGGCRNLQCEGSNDDNCGQSTSEVEWASQIGRVYYVFVYGSEGETGSFQLDVTGNAATQAPNEGSPITFNTDRMVGGMFE